MRLLRRYREARHARCHVTKVIAKHDVLGIIPAGADAEDHPPIAEMESATIGVV